MTERSNSIDQAERIRRLQERRATSGSTTRGGSRRRRPAAATRVLLTGLSIASFFTIGGSMVLASSNTASVATPALSTTAQPSAQSSAGAGATQATVTTPAASVATKSATATAPVVHTKTRGS